MERDWADLPPDLLTLIVENCSTTNPAYVEIRSVCKSWRRALTPQPRHLPPQPPRLLLPRDSKFGTELSFYDLAQRKTRRVELPFVRGKHLRGSSHGWLVLEHEHGVSLLNPITRSTIDLPPMRHQVWIQKAMLSCNPSEPGCFVVARFQSFHCELGFCRIGDARWTKLKIRGRDIMDFTCQNHLVYAMDSKKQITIFDPQNLSERVCSPHLSCNLCSDRVYLIIGDGEFGGPLIVRHSYPRLGESETKVSVYRWSDDGQPEWRKVTDIGKRVLFLHHFYENQTVSSANLQLEDWCGNQIFYDVRRREGQSVHIDINTVNLESRKDVHNYASSIVVSRPVSEITKWFTPSLI